MKFIKCLGLTVLLTGLFSCDNEVDINADFTEVTSVVGLLDVRQDSQFVKITRTFLDDELNAIQLANQSDRIYYDSLDVKLINNASKEEITLNKILLPKDPGIFTQEDNQAYFTDQQLEVNGTYNLVVNKPGEEVSTTGSVFLTNGAVLTVPRPSVNGKLNFVDFQKNILDNVRFEFQTSNNIGEFDVTLRFNYFEITNNIDTVNKYIDFPLSTFRNTSLESGKEFVYIFDANRFFNEIESTISTTTQTLTSLKRVLPEKGNSLIIESADGEYALYRDVNGPIDGLSQTRPEFTNVTNGIGLFASRTTRTWNLDFNIFTEDLIIQSYGDRNDLGSYRAFAYRD